MRRTKRIALAVLGLLGLVAPIAIAGSMAAIPAWFAVATAIIMMAGAAALAYALPRPDKKSDPEDRGQKKEEPKEDEKKEIPLTTANLEALMDGKTPLAEEDKEAINAIVRAGHGLMDHIASQSEPGREPPKKEMRKRILGYIKTPVSVPTPMGDHETVPITVFKPAQEKDKDGEELKTLMDQAFPPWPSRTHAHPRPLSRPIERGHRKTIRETAASFRALADSAPDEKARRTLLKLAEEADILDKAKKEQAAASTGDPPDRS